MTTLTDRYIYTALRSVPASKRSDIEAELRTLIADAVDARVAAGEDPVAAETAALTELGDPVRLAASYTDEPLHLIGPALFLDYLRLLRLLAVTGLPTTAIIVAVVAAAQGASVGTVIGRVIVTVLTVAVHLGFWTTLVFAVLERLPGIQTPLTGKWNPSMLPPVREASAKPAAPRGQGWEAGGLVVGIGIFATLILLAPGLSPQQDEAGQAINILDPWLWDTGVVYAYVGLLVLMVALSVAAIYRPRAGVAAALVGLLPAALLGWVAWQHHVLNPAFAAAVGWSSDVTDWIHLSLVAVAGLAIVTGLWEAIQKARRP